MNIRATRIVVAAAAAALLAVPVAASAAGHFAGPVFKLDSAPNGDILAADAGAGVAILDDGELDKTLPAPGAASVAAIGSKSFWVVTGGQDTLSDSGQALWRVSNGKARMIANMFELESADPDGSGDADSNPYDVAALGGGDAALVVDAGGNSLHKIDSDGNAELVATFPVELLSTDNFNQLAGCPPVAPYCATDGATHIPGQSVPTSVVVGPDGNYWVGELKGFPAPTGQSGVWRIEAGATDVECGVDPECVKVLDGFTSIVDLTVGPDGMLYVSEFDEKSWAAVEIFPSEAVGGTLNACDPATGDCTEVATGVPEHTSVAFDKAGTAWVTQHALSGAEVIALD
ncbi:ScyD/ScyE family protein [Salsipaludibacter albus]|uniref:ScyD/ScyE family protein n=1 Tax=Salsipaludibacter albus TaxID=2849650 RepID=UPI001EE47BB8|nr:ScyD/ScyE family protein [Salsipaludibacter albus]MBY5160925.1 ScyD/ScyE family protein [Salsipaludibacter albus]